MRPHHLARRGLSASAAGLLVFAAAACGGEEPVAQPTPPPSSAPTADAGSPDARAALAAKAARALDRSYAALYSLNDGSGQPRNVIATVGVDGTWRVDVAGGALGGTADVSIVSIATGVYQCTLSTPANPVASACVRVAEAGKRVPKAYDPKVQRLFRQWLPVFTDRQSALAVAEVQPLEGAQGTCFSIDSISAALAAPVDVGVYCYGDDGLLTAVRVGFGVLTLVSQVAGPPTVQLPGPESGGQPMGTSSPPPPPVIQPSAGQSPA